MEEAAVKQQLRVEELAFEFAAGLFGFPAARRFVVSQIPGGGDLFKQMLSVDQPGLGFTLVFPFAFFPDYDPDIPEADAQEIGAVGPDQIILMAIANVRSNFRETTVNLKAPIIFNPYTRQAKQVILTDDRLTPQDRLFKV